MSAAVKQWTVRYRAHNGVPRPAIVCVPSEYGPGRPSPPLPLVIAPHGRGVKAQGNANMWADLPARAQLAVVCPGGMGRRLPLHSWGYRGHIADLARMPDVVDKALPWLDVDRTRIYAIGGSMGGQETLLLVGQYPQLLAGAVAIDSVTNFHRRYADFGLSARTRGLQALARVEVGGTPKTNAVGYVLRSPTHWLKQLADSGVPLSVWWSIADQVVQDQIHQSAFFYEELQKAGPKARLESVTGFWSHSQAFSDVQLPGALRWLELLP